LAKTITIQPQELHARAYADRLILRELTDMEAALKLGELAERLSGVGLGLSAVRLLLASNPERFVYHDRRWIPASRLEGVGRPLNEAVRLMVDRFGGPVPIELIEQEILRLHPEQGEEIADRLYRSVKSDPNLILSEDGGVALADWAFLATDESVERAFALHNLTKEEVDEAAKRLAKVDWRAKDAAEQALKAGAPISAKALGAVAWLNLNAQDPRAVLLYDGAKLFGQLVSVDGFVYGSDGVFYPEEETKKWISAAIKLADKLAPTVEVEEAAPIEVKAADVKAMARKIAASDQTVTATRLLEEQYEITTANKTFPDDLANVVDALKAEDSVWWVGADRFRKPKTAPDFVYSVPEPFHFVQTNVTNEEGEPVDVELTDEGLSSSLRKLLQHPLAQDVLDEDIFPAPKTMPERLRLVIKSIHRELGTFPMCQIPTGWLDAEPAVQELIFVDPSGRELQVWANHEARLLYNLVDWWYEQPVESGAVFSLAKTNKPNVLEFSWDEQTDPVAYISNQRMEELRQIQADSEGSSTLDVLIQVMGHWPKGADFLTLLAEVNVVRRTTRRLLASLLSSYQCFYQRSGSPVWHFDNKKVDLGFDKTKKKFIKR
jgi:hypothetical protein